MTPNSATPAAMRSRDMRPRCCIHVGLPKTATTTLQFSLFPRHSQINYLGKPYYDERAGYEASQACAELVDSIWKCDSLAYSPERARDLFDHGVRPRLDAEKILVLSEEGLTFAGAVDRSIVAQRLKDLFGDCKILITIRNQIDCLRSGYLWLYTRRIVNRSFEGWIAQCLQKSLYRQAVDDFPLRQFLYAEVISLYERIFGSENVCVLLFEDLRYDHRAFIARLSTFLAINEQECLKHISGEHHNVSLSWLGIRYQRAVKLFKLISERLRGVKAPIPSEGLENDHVSRLVMGALSVLPKSDISMKSHTRALLEDYYRADNRLLVQRYSLPVNDYGYPI